MSFARTPRGISLLKSTRLEKNARQEASLGGGEGSMGSFTASFRAVKVVKVFRAPHACRNQPAAAGAMPPPHSPDHWHYSKCQVNPKRAQDVLIFHKRNLALKIK